MSRDGKRKLGLVAAVAMSVALVALPASATKPDPGSDLVLGHKIWVCHATSSLSNPYVKILIDQAAWNAADAGKGHSPQLHERNKKGVTWADYALDDPSEQCVIGNGDPQPPGGGGEL